MLLIRWEAEVRKIETILQILIAIDNREPLETQYFLIVLEGDFFEVAKFKGINKCTI